MTTIARVLRSCLCLVWYGSHEIRVQHAPGWLYGACVRCGHVTSGWEIP